MVWSAVQTIEAGVQTIDNCRWRRHRRRRKILALYSAPLAPKNFGFVFKTQVTPANEPLACTAVAPAARVPPRHASRGVSTAMQEYTRLQALCTCKSTVFNHTSPLLHLASRCTHGVSTLTNEPLACMAAAWAATVPPWHAGRWASTAMYGDARPQALCTRKRTAFSLCVTSAACCIVLHLS